MSQSGFEAIRAVCYKAGYNPDDFPDEVISSLVDWLKKEHNGVFQHLMIWNLKDGYDEFGAVTTEVWISLKAGDDIATWWSFKSGTDATFREFNPEVWVTDIPADYDFWRWWRKDFKSENDWFQQLKKKPF